MQITVDKTDKKILLPVALTATKSKIQIKNRSCTNEYGVSVAAVRDGFTAESYVEWMIGYDVKWGKYDKHGCPKKTTNKDELKKLINTTLQNKHFIGANGYIKSFYELSEYLYYFYDWGIIKKKALNDIKKFLQNIPENNLLENDSNLQINRSASVQRAIDNFDFEYTRVKYPLLIYKFSSDFNILAEIKISEKQKAVGIQPMLFLCFPVEKLKSNDGPLVGRSAKKNEIAYFEINKDNIGVFLEITKIFGILSESHRHDIMTIIDTILK